MKKISTGLLRAALLLCMVCSVAACEEEGDNYLEGALTKSYDMKFGDTQVLLYTSDMAIEYLQGDKMPLRVTVKLASDGLNTGVTYDLANAGTVSRGIGYPSELPELESGSLQFSKVALEDGSDIKGTFEAVFLGTDGSRMSLRGGFAAPLEVIDF